MGQLKCLSFGITFVILSILCSISAQGDPSNTEIGGVAASATATPAPSDDHSNTENPQSDINVTPETTNQDIPDVADNASNNESPPEPEPQNAPIPINNGGDIPLPQTVSKQNMRPNNMGKMGGPNAPFQNSPGGPPGYPHDPYGMQEGPPPPPPMYPMYGNPNYGYGPPPPPNPNYGYQNRQPGYGNPGFQENPAFQNQEPRFQNPNNFPRQNMQIQTFKQGVGNATGQTSHSQSYSYSYSTDTRINVGDDKGTKTAPTKPTPKPSKKQKQ